MDLELFLDSLGTLGALLSVALEQVQDARDEFILNANEKQFGSLQHSATEAVLFGAVREAVQPNRVSGG